MQFLIKSLNTGATGYFLEVYTNKLPKYGLPAFCLNDFNNDTRLINRVCKSNGIHYLAGFSTTESKTAHVVYENTGKKGRPKRVVLGDKVPAHMHVLVLGDAERSARQTAYEIKRRIDKKYMRKGFPSKICKVRSVSDGPDLWDSAQYIIKQAENLSDGDDPYIRNYLNGRI